MRVSKVLRDVKVSREPKHLKKRKRAKFGPKNFVARIDPNQTSLDGGFIEDLMKTCEHCPAVNSYKRCNQLQNSKECFLIC